MLRVWGVNVSYTVALGACSADGGGPPALETTAAESTAAETTSVGMTDAGDDEGTLSTGSAGDGDTSTSSGAAEDDTGGSDGGGGNFSAGCGQAPPASPPASVDVGAQTRTYVLDLPNAYDERIAYPLIFGWHGTGHQGSDARQQMRLLEAAGGNAVVVYPDGGSTAPVWQFPGGAGVSSPQADVNFFDAMAQQLGELYCINGDRIFSTGFSQGAFLSNALACERSWAVRGIAPVGGGGPWLCDPVPMAAMIIIGTNDTVSGENADLGYNNSAQRSRDFWQMGSGCRDTTTQVAPSPCVAYDCPDEHPLEFCEFVGGHQWWGQASAGMIDFFFAL